MLFLLAVFMGPYYVLARRFFRSASRVEAFLYGFVLSCFVKLVFFVLSISGFAAFRHTLLIETLLCVMISVYITYREKMWREFVDNIREIGVFFVCFILLSCVVFFFSFRFGWDSDEFYLAYSKLYYEENRLVGFSPEISNYLSIPPLTSIIYAWTFCITGPSDLSTFFLPIVAFIVNVLGVYALSRKYLNTLSKPVLIVTAMNLALVASLILVPRYADLLFSALCIILFNLISSQKSLSDRRMWILLIFILTIAISCKVFAFGLYFFILLLLVQVTKFSHNALKYAILPIVWVPFLYISTLVMPISNISVQEGTQGFFQMTVVIFLSLLSLAYFFIVRISAGSITKTGGTRVKIHHSILLVILLVLPSIPYFFYEYSLSGTFFFPYVKASSMSVSQDLLLQTSKEIGRVESTPISVLYLLASPCIWPFLPFFFFEIFAGAYRILKNETQEKDILVFQILVFCLLFLLMDLSFHMAVRIRHQIPIFLLYQLVSVLGFFELLGRFGLSTRSRALAYVTFFSSHVLFDFTRFHIELPTHVEPLSLPMSAMQIVTLFVLVLLVTLSSKPLRAVNMGISMGRIHKILSGPLKRFFEISCLIILIISLSVSSSSIIDYWEDYYPLTQPQRQMMEALRTLPDSNILTFGVSGGYYHGGHQTLGIHYVESLSLIYPMHTQDLATFVEKLIDMNLVYVVLPSGKNFFFTAWYESFAKRIPVFNVFRSRTVFPLTQHLDLALFDIIYFNTTALPQFLDEPHFIHAKAAGEFVVPDLIGDEPLEYWHYAGRSQTVSLSFNLFLPEGYDLADVSISAGEAFYFHNDTLIRRKTVLDYAYQKDTIDLLTISMNLTGIRADGLRWHSISIENVTVSLSCATSHDCALVLVTSSEKPLTLWYTSSTNEWSLEEGTYRFRELVVTG